MNTGILRTTLPFLLVISVGCAHSKPTPPPAPQISFEQMHNAWVAAATVGPEHKSLSILTGTWKADVKFWQDPNNEPELSKGTTKFTPILGGRFIKQEFTGKAFGLPMKGIGVLGYDNMKKVYTSAWIDSTSTSIMTSSGSYDTANRTWTYTSETECPFAPGAKMQITEKMSILEKNKVKFEMFQTDPKGIQSKTLEINYTRTK